MVYGEPHLIHGMTCRNWHILLECGCEILSEHFMCT